MTRLPDPIGRPVPRPGSARPLLSLVALGSILAAALQVLPAAALPDRRAIATTAARPRAAAAPEAHLLLRTGDPAPVEARVGASFGGELAELPGGGLLFRPEGDDSLMLLEAGVVRIVLNIGDRIDGCGTVSHIYQFSAGGDGSVAALVECYAVQAIVRLDMAGGPAETALATGMTMTIAGTPAEIGRVRGTALDGQGRLVAAVDDGPELEAIVRQSPGGEPEILIESGDALGVAAFASALREPAVNDAGDVAFSATTSAGTEVIATLTAGGTPSVLFSAPIAVPPGPSAPTLALAPPVLNDAGVVGFLWGDPAAIRVLRAAGGVVATVAEAGDPAPGGGTFSAITWVYPAIDAAGGVIFGARRSNGIGGLYRADGSTTKVAEQGDITDQGGSLVGVGDWSITPLVGADGAVRFTAIDTEGVGLFAAGAGVVSVDLRAGIPLDEPARFVRFDASLSYFLPHLSSGPGMASDGGVVFDAVVTGRGRGLFARAGNGTIVPVALDGDPAPGGGHFDGAFFTYASIAPGGRVAFLGAAPDDGRGSALQLYAGAAGGGIARVVGGGDLVPGFAAPISSLLPPSPINAAGQVAVPAFLADGTWILLVWDGTALGVFAATGDTLPGGGTIAMLRLGQPGALLTPLLDDAGNLFFGAVTSGGTAALYRASLPGGLGSAIHLIGDGDLVQGGTLSPFRPQVLAVDRSGRFAFEAVPAPATAVATFSADVGPIPRLVRAPANQKLPPPPPGPPPVAQALPRLAATAEGGVVHEDSGGLTGRKLLFATPRVPTDPDPDLAYDHVALVGPFVASPDGGLFTRPFSITPPGGATGRAPLRLGSDGDRYAVAVEPTSQGPEILVLFDLRPNREPVGVAGPDQTIECTGPDGAEVALDAGGSSDPDGDPLEYAWTGPFGSASGPSPVVTVPIGSFTITLTVTDPSGAVAVDTLLVTVRDTVAPTLAARAVPDLLWPPDGRLAPVFFGIATSDRCDPRPSVTLLMITSNDPKFDPAADVSGAAYGTNDRVVSLRATRSGGIGGRTYAVTFGARDRSGNAVEASVSVLVPQSQKK